MVRDGDLTVDQVLAQHSGQDEAHVSFRSGTGPAGLAEELAADAASQTRLALYQLEEDLAEAVRRAGFTPRQHGPREPHFDLAFEDESGHLVICEIKVAGDGSEQLWAAVGQLDRYLFELEGARGG